ncbi:hypothetical protein EV182_001400 [Spiromyces aspiralis]|uniref:Uncharacterized protein n=1 Tax=Spiromyces aspiralis TaxID=68401 RepID=A0ACC1HWR1_9FUNG|nr:hypothetical protein EV182_001400 [Spiromyces aspiralis]
MAFGWRNVGLNYLEYSNIAARALRRVLVEKAQPAALKRNDMAIKFSQWSNGKAGELKPINIVGKKADA